MEESISFVKLREYLMKILGIRGFTDNMKRSVIRLQYFFNDKQGERYSFYDIRVFIESYSELQGIIESKECKDGFDSEEHKLNYAFQCIKNEYEVRKKNLENHLQQELQERVVKPMVDKMTDNEIYKMLNDIPDNQSNFENVLPESKSKEQNEDNNAIEAESKNANGNVENDNELDARLEAVKNQVSEEFNKRLAALEKEWSKQLLEIKCALPVDEARSTEDKPKRRGRPKKDVVAINTKKCLCCGKEKRMSEKALKVLFTNHIVEYIKVMTFFFRFAKSVWKFSIVILSLNFKKLLKKQKLMFQSITLKRKQLNVSV